MGGVGRKEFMGRSRVSVLWERDFEIGFGRMGSDLVGPPAGFEKKWLNLA
jgi:hypothetical protein